jgi:hypothetical protein
MCRRPVLTRRRCQPAGRLRLGVTGHRVVTDVSRVVEGIRAAVRAIQTAAGVRPLTVMSALAEGADRLVVEEVLGVPDACLVAVLPFAPDRYADDFGGVGSPSHTRFLDLLQRASAVHVMPTADSKPQAYRLAGEYVLEQCDVLLAVWDGQIEQGEGGTAQIVGLARARAKPLVIVRAGNRRPGTLEPTSLGQEQGRIVVERLAALE